MGRVGGQREKVHAKREMRGENKRKLAQKGWSGSHEGARAGNKGRGFPDGTQEVVSVLRWQAQGQSRFGKQDLNLIVQMSRWGAGMSTEVWRPRPCRSLSLSHSPEASQLPIKGHTCAGKEKLDKRPPTHGKAPLSRRLSASQSFWGRSACFSLTAQLPRLGTRFICC